MDTHPSNGTAREWLPPIYKAIENCLIFTYRRVKLPEERWAFSWTSRMAQMTARVEPNVSAGSITITVTDDTNSSVIELWTSKVLITGDKWRQRLRETAGGAVVLAQRRPKCPLCRGEMSIQSAEEGRQRFICSKPQGCPGQIGITDHDIERKDVGSTGSRPPERTTAAHATPQG